MHASVLTQTTFAEGLRYLSERDNDLAQILDKLGAPPMWSREPGFPTLVYIILEQQVSLASAKAAFTRLLAAASPLTPQRFLELDDHALKRIGFSRQKMIYSRHLAEAVLQGRLDLDALEIMDDEAARAALIEMKGIGPWTADIYLLMVLHRPDVWPSGDIALAKAVQVVKKLPARPLPGQLIEIAQAWQPWRAVAARLLWHFYLSGGHL